MIITNKQNLRELVNLVHDYWFNVENVNYDPVSETVTLRAEPRHSALSRGSRDGIMIEVKNVESFAVKDTEKVRDYDINEITFDPATNTLLITGGIPIELAFSVRRLELHASAVQEA
jgi:hypothetical protein